MITITITADYAVYKRIECMYIVFLQEVGSPARVDWRKSCQFNLRNVVHAAFK